MDGEARQLPPEPGETEEAILRAAGMWPPDMQGYVTDPLLQEKRHWTRALALACREGIALTDRVRVHLGDVLAMLRELRDASVHCVVTSPPYWGLRDYGLAPTDWPEVTYRPAWDLPEVTIPTQQCCLGLEPDVLVFIGHLVLVFREVARVLRPDGACWVNLGDGYATGTNSARKPSGKHARNVGHIPESAPHRRKPASWTNRCQSERRSPGGLTPKNLLLAPHRVALALQADGWIVRQDNVWSKPSPMPESTADRTTRSHEYVFHLTRGQRYFHDALAVAEPTVEAASGNLARVRRRDRGGIVGHCANQGFGVPWSGQTRNPRSVWLITAAPCRDAHFATFPPELPRRCILASTSEVGCCPTCGTSWTRMVEVVGASSSELARERGMAGYSEAYAHYGRSKQALNHRGKHTDRARVRVTVGWRLPCKCPLRTPVPCTVLDPFAGTFTTGAVAHVLGREAVGVDAQRAYFPMMVRRMAETIASASKAGRAAKPPWARSWGRPKQLGMVPGADPDPEREPEPGVFTVDVAVWSSWPEDARAALRAAAPWSKAPGVMRTDPLDGPTAERVRSVAAQRQLVGLEELGAPPQRPFVETVEGGDEPMVMFANPPRFVGGRCEDCGAPAPFPSDLCVACVKRRRDAGEAA